MNVEREILSNARSSPTYHAGVAMATHPVNASPAKRKEKRGKKAGTSAQAQQDEEIKNKFSTPTPPLIPQSSGL